MAYTTNLPVNGTFNITAAFGQIGSYWKNGHKGIDVTASDKRLYSICDGVVTVVAFDAGGWGRYVSIKPDGFDRIRIILCHMVDNSVKVKKGDRVTRLTQIGTMGSTGNSTGVHCHVEIRIDNTPVNPAPYMLIPNAKTSSLKASNFKFDGACQNAALTSLQNAFDNKTEAPKADTVCSGSADDEIKKLKDEAEVLLNELNLANKKIENAIKALS